MKKKMRRVLSTVCICVLLIGIGYLGICLYFEDRFLPGVYINGSYCTGRTVEEVNTELVSLYDVSTFILQDENQSYEIPLSELGFGIDYTGQLETGLNSGVSYLWISHIFSPLQTTLHPQIGYEEEKLITAVRQCGILENNACMEDESEDASFTVEIKKENAYVLYDGRKHVLDLKAVWNRVMETLKQGEFTVSVEDCYVDLPYTDDMEDTFALWEKVQAFQNCGIVYDMGDEQILLTPEIMSGWITVDERGNILLDEEGRIIPDEAAVIAFIDALCEEYDTFEKPRIFAATRGEDVTVESGTYGTLLDKEAEISYLLQALWEGKEETHIPAYKKEAYHRGKNDIGDTYVEVDMTAQKLYYYEDGVLLIETDVVTGNLSRGRGTPGGVYYVYAMQRNRILRGPGYEAFVSYWAPINGGIGLHDASWNRSFGGDYYKTNGSHGCINIPPDDMPELYEHLEIGMPVILFY